MARNAETRYAWNGNVALAYQVFSAGPVDLVYLQGYISHVDLNWDSPYLARFLRGLGQRARVIHTDRRGWGCSDRFSPGDVAPLEVQVDDLVVVMDAAGSERAVIFTSVDTCPTGVLFAATYPERTAGLVLVDPLLAFYHTDEARREWAETNARVRREWGTPAYYGEDWHDVREQEDWYARWCRASVAPGALAAESDAFGAVDVRRAPRSPAGGMSPGDWRGPQLAHAARRPRKHPTIWGGIRELPRLAFRYGRTRSPAASRQEEERPMVQEQTKRRVAVPRMVGLAVVGLALAACGGAAATAEPASPASAASPVDVALQEWAVVPAQATAKAGSITFNVTNNGPDDTHEFVVFRTDLGQRDLPTAADGSVDEEGEGVTPIGEIEDVTTGTTSSVTFDLAPGKYVFVCNLVEEADGKTEVHYALGMSAAFTVE